LPLARHYTLLEQESREDLLPECVAAGTRSSSATNDFGSTCVKVREHSISFQRRHRRAPSGRPNGASTGKSPLLPLFETLVRRTVLRAMGPHERKPIKSVGVTMMTRRRASTGILASAALAGAPGVAMAQEPKARQLPPPHHDGGMPLMAALKLRHSTREYSNRPLAAQTLSDLLWAAFGINRPSGDRTAPYWRHVMIIDVYAAMADGVWLYDAKAHALLPYLRDDIRAATGMQDFVATAPLNLVYVAHGERMADITPEERRLYASVDTGFIGQNVYLFCASEGLATVFRGAVDYPKLARTMTLPEQQFVTFAHTVGYPRA